MFFAAQIFGVLAMLSLFAAYLQKKRTSLLAGKMCADAFWVGHYFFLGGVGGMATNFIGIFREIVFYQRDRSKWANSKLIPVIFVLLNLCVGFLTFKEPVNILPIFASILATISLWLRDPKITKKILIPVCLAYLVYNILVGSVIGAINESASLLSIAISFFRDRKKKS